MHILFPQISSSILAIVLIILFIPILALTVRRLHDSERNGWLVLVSLAPLILMIVISAITSFYFRTGRTEQNSFVSDVIIDVPDDAFTENGGIIADSLKNAKKYTWDGNGGLIEYQEPSKGDTSNIPGLFVGTAGILSMLFIFWIVSFILLIVWCTLPGTEGPNKYGPDPHVATD